MPKTEYKLQKHVCVYLRRQYPDVCFRSDLGGVKLGSIGYGVKLKALQDGRKWPDLFIAEPKGGYCGMFIEMKAQKKYLFKKDNTFRESKHIVAQVKMLEMLIAKGYCAFFAWNFDEMKKAIDDYLAGKIRRENEGMTT